MREPQYIFPRMRILEGLVAWQPRIVLLNDLRLIEKHIKELKTTEIIIYCLKTVKKIVCSLSLAPHAPCNIREVTWGRLKRSHFHFRSIGMGRPTRWSRAIVSLGIFNRSRRRARIRSAWLFSGIGVGTMNASARTTTNVENASRKIVEIQRRIPHAPSCLMTGLRKHLNTIPPQNEAAPVR